MTLARTLLLAVAGACKENAERHHLREGIKFSNRNQFENARVEGVLGDINNDIACVCFAMAAALVAPKPKGEGG